MKKSFTNSLGQRLSFNDDGINFEARGKFCPYEHIDAIGLGLMGIFSVSCNGITYTFAADSEDKAELRELAKAIKEKQSAKTSAREVSEDVVKNGKKNLQSDLLAELFIALPIVGLVALMLFVVLPNVSGIWGTIVMVAFVVIMLFALLLLVVSLSTSLKGTVLPELKGAKAFYNTLQVLIVVLCVAASAGLFFLHFDGNNVGYKSGDYSELTCYDCGEPADGGMWKGGRHSSDEHYCKKHFEERKELFDAYRDKNAGEDDFGHDEYDAWTAARDIVEGKLKSPSTAKFCSVTNASIERDGNTWTIIGYVDAQNSFGATLRNNFTVKITFTSSTKYTIDQCSITAK